MVAMRVACHDRPILCILFQHTPNYTLLGYAVKNLFWPKRPTIALVVFYCEPYPLAV